MKIQVTKHHTLKNVAGHRPAIVFKPERCSSHHALRWPAGLGQASRLSPANELSMPILLVDKSVKPPRVAIRNLLSGNQETRYSFDSWLLGLLIKMAAKVWPDLSSNRISREFPFTSW
jgi:hypothetical protein